MAARKKAARKKAARKKAALPKAPEKSYHFFGSTACGWAKGQSRAEVLDKLARNAGESMIKEQVKEYGGLYAYVCRIEGEQSTTSYGIESYRPTIGYTAMHCYRVQNIKGHVIPIEDICL